MAQNPEGVGQPGPCSEPVLVRDPIYPPGEPRLVKVTDTTRSTASISWSPPTYDGGSEVSAEII